MLRVLRLMEEGEMREGEGEGEGKGGEGVGGGGGEGVGEEGDPQPAACHHRAGGPHPSGVPHSGA